MPNGRIRKITDHGEQHEPIADLLAQGVGQAGVGRVLKTVRKYLGMDVAFIAQFRDRDRVFETVDAEPGAPLQDGFTMPLDQGYCMKLVRGELPRVIPDTGRSSAAMSIPETAAIPIGSHIGVPIVLESGELYGTLCCFSYLPDQTLGDRELKMLQAFAEVVATRISETRAMQRNKTRRIDEVRSAMAAGAPRIVFQPIYQLKTLELAGVECLSRFDLEPYQSPDKWFALAHEVGLGLELERAAIERGLGARDQFQGSLFLGINGSPELIVSPALASVLPRGDLSRIMLEITEHAVVADYEHLVAALEPLRVRGLRIAIDDAGAGYASMLHIVNLHPDLIKLDMSLTEHIDTDPRRRALARALIAFARDIGSGICAEGVETEGELEMLRSLGVDLAQGYYLSKPLLLEEAVRLQGSRSLATPA
jgi:EAL domain-containing protein (putative c-di-GMP-specific phosphodiesterase class I)